MPQFTKLGVIQRDAYPDLLDKSMDVVWNRRDEFRGELGQFFETIDAESDTFKISSIGSALPLPKENEDTDGIPMEQPAPGHTKTITLIPYRQGIRVTDSMVSTERFGKVASMVQGIVKSPMQLREYQRATVFDNAFSGTAGADSLSLCSNSHPHENITAGTWDNLTTGVLNGDNLQAAHLLHRKIKNEQNNPDPVRPRVLLIPPDLLQMAEELTASVQKPETALNQPNVLIKSFGIVVSEYLNSTTAWFTIGDLTGEERGLVEIVNQALNIKPMAPETDILFARRSKSIHAVTFTLSKNVVGSAGS